MLRLELENNSMNDLVYSRCKHQHQGSTPQRTPQNFLPEQGMRCGKSGSRRTKTNISGTGQDRTKVSIEDQ